MTPIKTFLLIVSLLLLPISSSFAESRLIAWTAANVGGKIVTNYDVEKYIEDTLLNDRIKAVLFAKAGNFNQYQIDKSNWLNKHFEMGLKKLVYAKIIQLEATRKKVNEKRVAFTTTEKEYYEAIRGIESRVLDPVMERDKQGIRPARIKYGEFLRSSNYPYKKEESLTDTYFRWYNAEQERLKEQFRERGVKQWQGYQGTKGHELYVRPTDMFDFNKEVTTLVEEKLAGKNLSKTEVDKILGEDPRLKVIIENVHYLNFQSSSLFEFYTQDRENWESTKAEIVNKLAENLTSEKISKILKYENLTQKFIKKYKTPEKLYEKSRKALEKFQAPDGDFNDFMLARIYSLAASGIEQAPNRNELRKKLASALEAVFPELLELLKEDDIYIKKEHQKLDIESLLSIATYELINKQIKIPEDKESYLKKFINLAVWVIKFEGK
ncbi:MAG: hypothetical protein HOM21_04545, partial [Halobacteriovoraceae bacterium]|nr:hypothetical protein [Halobacteriovoraceae bacterium]